MKIREVKLNKFKRFTDLTITGIPQTAKLEDLMGVVKPLYLKP